MSGLPFFGKGFGFFDLLWGHFGSDFGEFILYIFLHAAPSVQVFKHIDKAICFN